MKKLIFSAAVLASAFFAASCQQEMLEPQAEGNTVTFEVSIPEVATKSYDAEGKNVNDLVYAVYSTEAETLEAAQESDLTFFYAVNETSGASFDANGKSIVSLELLNDQNYLILFWAQSNDAWVSAQGSNINLLNVTYPTSMAANNKYLEAFSGVSFIKNVKGARKETVKLTRPFAQINLATTMPQAFTATLRQSDMSVAKAAASFNVAKQLASGERTVSFTAANVPVADFKTGYTYAGANYIFANGTVDVTYNIYTSHGDVNNTVSNVPVEKNYRTNILGNLLTSQAEYTVELEKEWATPDEKVLVTDINPAIRTITINSVDELLSLNSLNENWNALFSNGQGTDITNFFVENGGKGADYYYKWEWTIKLNADLDLNNIILNAPINVSSFGCFDGKNHTIKNVKIETATDVDTAAGLFEASKACKIQNIKLDNVHVKGSLVGNSTAGILVSDCNSTIDNITIANSSVYGGKYTGGVVGYGYTNVINCTLTNCVVKGGYKLGGVIGYICASDEGSDVTGCTLTGCTVSGTDGQYAGGKSEYIMGKVVGNYNCNGVCAGNIINDMNTTATANIGKIEAGKTVRAYIAEMDAANRTITVNSAAALLELTWLNENWNALFSNGQGTDITNFFVENGGKGSDYYYKWDWTIKLNADLDFDNITLDAPINVSGFGCFDGKNHTIKNVTIKTATDVDTAAGLFEASKACKMQNIKLDNVHVTGSLVGGSTAGILVSDCNSGINNITITNSSVYGGKYTGGVVGYGYTYVTNCTLTNCVVKGGYKLGGVIGYICASDEGNDVTGCTLTGCTVSGTDGQYAGGKSEYIMGKVVGNYNCNGTCSGNTVTKMTTGATHIIGKKEAGCSVTVENNVMGVSSWDELKTSIVNGDIIELDNDITVDEWVMFSEDYNIGDGTIITIDEINVTIDGKGHTLTVNAIESAGNNDQLFQGASNLNISDLTIKYADGLTTGGLGMVSGVIKDVRFVGGGAAASSAAIFPGTGIIKVEDCIFDTNGVAIYFEDERDNLTVTGCTFNQKDNKNVILLRGDVHFTNNIINSGRTVNVVSGSPVVTGNNFNNVRLKVYAAATAKISKNIINNLEFDTTTYSSTFVDNTLSDAAQAALNAVTKN